MAHPDRIITLTALSVPHPFAFAQATLLAADLGFEFLFLLLQFGEARGPVAASVGEDGIEVAVTIDGAEGDPRGVGDAGQGLA